MAVVGVLFGDQMIFNGGGYVFSRKLVFLGFYMMTLCFPLGKKALNTLLPTPERPGYGYLISVLVSCRR